MGRRWQRGRSPRAGLPTARAVREGEARSPRAGQGPGAHLQTVIKFRLSTAALREGTLFLRAETLSPPKPRDAISAGRRWSRQGWRGAFVLGLPGSRMLRPPPHAKGEAPVRSPLLLPPPGPCGSSAPRRAAGRAAGQARQRRGARGGGGPGPPAGAGSRAATAPRIAALQSAGAASQSARGRGAAPAPPRAGTSKGRAQLTVSGRETGGSRYLRRREGFLLPFPFPLGERRALRRVWRKESAGHFLRSPFCQVLLSPHSPSCPIS